MAMRTPVWLPSILGCRAPQQAMHFVPPADESIHFLSGRDEGAVIDNLLGPVAFHAPENRPCCSRRAQFRQARRVKSPSTLSRKVSQGIGASEQWAKHLNLTVWPTHSFTLPASLKPLLPLFGLSSLPNHSSHPSSSSSPPHIILAP